MAQSSTLRPVFFSRGDKIRAHVRASDGQAWSARLYTPEVVIHNTPPRIHQASIQSTSPIHGLSQVEVVANASDIDEDSVSIRWTWYVDGAPLLQSGDQITLPGMPAGSWLSALGIPYDEMSRGEIFRTPAIRVGTVPSEIASVSIEPAQPLHRDDLRCRVEAPPIELPNFLSIEWEAEGPNSGAPQSSALPSNDTVSWKLTTAGEHWTCTAVWPGGLALDSHVEIGRGPPGGNILLVLIDDVGVDKVGAYGEHPNPPPTPTIDALAADGILFRNAHTYPVCTPARAALITGRYGHRTGIGHLPGGMDLLPTEEIGIAEMLDHSTVYDYSNSLVGKWHLAGRPTAGWLMHPAAFGFDWFGTVPANLKLNMLPNSGDYFDWIKNTNGVLESKQTYATTDQINDAISRIAAMPQPWFLYLSLSAPHSPVHAPPDDLHSYHLSEDSTRLLLYNAMMEAVDTELGRLLDSMDPEVLEDTTIILMSDNGTPYFAIEPPFNTSEAKGSLQDGGTRVPLIISGPLVEEPGSEVSAFVHVVDLFPTIAEIAGAEIEELFASDEGPGSLTDWTIDGDSLFPFFGNPEVLGREVIYTEKFTPNGVGVPRTTGVQSVRDERWRYIRYLNGYEQFYDLTTHYPNGGPNLLEQQLSAEAEMALEQLSNDLDHLINDLGG